MKINKIWFDGEWIYGLADDGKTYRQSLLWYKELAQASEAQRQDFEISTIGIHWRKLGVDVSFESFAYDEAEPSELQRFFLTHPDINIASFAEKAGIHAGLLRDYINGFKKPLKECEQKLLQQIHQLEKELTDVRF